MSKKRGMSKQQRLYYEYQNKERVRQELIELTKQTKAMEDKRITISSFNPHEYSYFN
jgi:hypothetical protein